MPAYTGHFGRFYDSLASRPGGRISIVPRPPEDPIRDPDFAQSFVNAQNDVRRPGGDGEGTGQWFFRRVDDTNNTVAFDYAAWAGNPYKARIWLPQRLPPAASVQAELTFQVHYVLDPGLFKRWVYWLGSRSRNQHGDGVYRELVAMIERTPPPRLYQHLNDPNSNGQGLDGRVGSLQKYIMEYASPNWRLMTYEEAIAVLRYFNLSKQRFRAVAVSVATDLESLLPNNELGTLWLSVADRGRETSVATLEDALMNRDNFRAPDETIDMYEVKAARLFGESNPHAGEDPGM